MDSGVSTVTTTNESGAGSLGQAISDSNGDLTDITISVSGTLTLTVALPTVTSSYDIIGNGSFEIDINGVEYAFVLGAGADGTLSTVLMKNANRSTGCFLRAYDGATFEFNVCAFEDNNATNSRALLWCHAGAVDITFTDCFVTDIGTAGLFRRSIELGGVGVDSSLTISGGEWIRVGTIRPQRAMLDISNVVFDADTMANAGPCFWDQSGTYSSGNIWTFTDVTIRNYHKADGGGALRTEVTSELYLIRCKFDSNTAEYLGGALRTHNLRGIFYMEDCEVLDNACTTSGNENGGFAYLAVDSVNKLDSFTIKACSFYRNSAEGRDSGVFQFESFAMVSGNGTIDNCTFFENTSVRWGGVARIAGMSSEIDWTNCTFYSNTASTSGGCFYEGVSTNNNFYNCIFWGNTALGSGNTFYGTNYTGQHNLMDYDGSGQFVDGDSDDNKLGTGYTSGLSDISNNGGLVLTCAINNDSDAKNAGDDSFISESYDARGLGFARKVGTVDMGAFEIQPLVGAGLRLTGPFYS